ncbi:MAG: carboxymuconolactone decarboxylase family protein [Thermoplasmatota archaeon]
MDIEEKLEKANEWMKKFGEKSPKNMGEFGGFMEAVESEGALSPKDKELMAIALSITHEY